MKSYLLYLTVFLITLIGCEVENKNNNHPNVIYILADDMGIGDVSLFNPDGKIRTPNLGQLGNEGMIFTDAHTSSSVCTPTRYGILTGRYSWRSKLKQGVLTGKSKALIPNDRTTVASMLREQGYKTGFIGKWHLGWDWALKDSVDNTGTGWNKEDFDNIDFTRPVTNHPGDLGFDYSYGHSGSLDMAPYVYVENGNITGIPNKVTVDTGQYSWWREGPTGSDFDHEDVTPNFFRRAIDFIKSSTNDQKPFFLYLALPSPHTPILPPAEWDGGRGFLPDGDFGMMIDGYIGQLIKTVGELGIEENTLIIFTTDNGCSPAAGFDELRKMGHEPSYVYRGHKADIYEGGHRVPFIAKWPMVISPGSTNNQLISATDLMATLAEITNYELSDDEGEDSFSSLPTFNNQPTSRTDMVQHSINGNFALRKGKWKLIMTGGSGGWSYPNPGQNQGVLDSLPPYQLYNLELDPGETENLFEEEQSVVQELKSLLVDDIRNGRTTMGANQENDPIDFDWSQIAFTEGQD